MLYPPAIPPTQPLQILAQLMVTMNRDQVVTQREQLEKLQDQAERQTQVLARLVRVAFLLPPPPLPVVMHRLGDDDDPMDFLETF